MNTINKVKNQNILLLQGPMGNFFKKLDMLLQKNGATTYTIGFNMGDSFFSSHHNYTPYRDTQDNYEDFIKLFLKNKKIDKIFLFGDCRFYQSKSIKIAMDLKIDVFVFEEGYIRPNYITMEKYGVNDFSHINRDSEFYRNLKDMQIEKTKNVRYNPFKMVSSSTLYYLLSNIFQFRYPNYIHHRDFSAIKEFFFGVRSLVRKYIYKFYEKDYLEMVQNELSHKYFFVPLQTHNDFQILQHSGYRSIEKFIIEVLESFAKQDIDDMLIFKHHPVDRGRKNYKDFILEQATILGIEKKVLIFYDTYLPIVLKKCKRYYYSK